MAEETSAATEAPPQEGPQPSPVFLLKDNPEFRAADVHTRADMFSKAVREEQKSPAIRQRYMDQPEEKQRAFSQALFNLPRLGPNGEALTAHNPYTGTGEALDPGTTNPISSPAEATKILGRAAVRAADTAPGMIVGGVGGALKLYGDLPEVMGLQSPETKNIFQRAGDYLTSPPAVRPLETAIAGKEGFKFGSPGLETMQRYVDAAVVSGAGSAIVAKAAPLLQEGIPIPALIIRGMSSGLQGRATADIVKELGGSPWAQVIGELVGGGVPVDDVARGLIAIKDRPALQRYIASNVKKQPNVESNVQGARDIQATVPGYEPTLAEATLSPGIAAGQRNAASEKPLTTGVELETRRQGNVAALSGGVEDVAAGLPPGAQGPTATTPATLENVVERAKAPVRTAEADYQTALAEQARAQAEGKVLSSDITMRLRAAQDDMRARLTTVEADLQLAQDEARRGVGGATDRLQKAQDDYRTTIRQIEDAQNAAQVAARRANKGVASDLRAQQDELTRVKIANERDEAAAEEWAKAHFDRLSPEMAANLRKRGQTGRAGIEESGATGANVFDQIDARKEKAAKDIYGAIYDTYGVAGDEKFNTNFLQEYLPGGNFDSTMASRMQGRYEPDPVLRDIADYVREKGVKLGIIERDMPLTLAEQPPSIPLTIQDLHSMLSSAQGALRHLPSDSPRGPSLRALIGSLYQQMDILGEVNPGARDALRFANAWYRQESLRTGTGPGYVATRINPRTGDPFFSPYEVGNTFFAPGPEVGAHSRQRSQNLDNFTTYMRDLDETLTSAQLKGDVQFASDIQAAKDTALRSAKIKFYEAAIKDDGSIDQTAAEKWIKQHDALIQSRPEYKQAFRTARDRLAAMREVQNDAAHLVAEQQGYLEQFEHTRQLTAERGEESTFQAGQTARGERRAAQDVLTSEQRAATQEREQAGEDLLFSTRAAKTERSYIQEDMTTRRRSLEDLRAAHRERQQSLDAEVVRAREARNDALAEYQRTFQGSASAKDSLLDEHATQVLGADPMSIVRDIEAMGSVDKQNRAYARWMRDAAGDPETKRAILAAKWKNFLGKEGAPSTNLEREVTLPSPEAAAAFLKENRPFLERYFPDYIDNLTTIQDGFQRAAFVEAQARSAVPSRLEGLHVSSGHHFNYWMGAVYPLALGNNAWKAAVLREAYLNPEATGLLARIMNEKTSPQVRNTLLFSVLARTGAFEQTLTQPGE